jgi:hypothetical protein
MTLAVLAATAAPAGQPVPPLEPVAFHTVAKDDGASSRLTERTGMVIRGDRRWKRTWRRLTRPRVHHHRRHHVAVSRGTRPP